MDASGLIWWFELAHHHLNGLLFLGVAVVLAEPDPHPLLDNLPRGGLPRCKNAPELLLGTAQDAVTSSAFASAAFQFLIAARALPVMISSTGSREVLDLEA